MFSLDTDDRACWFALSQAVNDFLVDIGSSEIGPIGGLVYQHHFKALQDPLHMPPKSPQDRQTVEKQCNDQDRLLVLRLADELDVNEALVLQLWQLAKDPSTEPSLTDKLGFANGVLKHDPTLISVELFYYQRSCLLESLLNLLKLRNPSSDITAGLSQEKYNWVLELTDSLLSSTADPSSQPLGVRLLARLEAIDQRIRDLLSPKGRGVNLLQHHVDALQKERRQLCDCLFVLFYHTQPEAQEATKVIQLCQTMSNRWVEQPETVTSQSEASATYECMYVLLMTVGCMLDQTHSMYDRHTTRRLGEYVTGNQLGENREFMAAMEALIGTTRADAPQLGGNSAQQPWKHDAVHGVVLLFWGLFLVTGSSAAGLSSSRDRHIAVLQSAFKHRALAFLRGLLRSPELAHDEYRGLIVSIVDELVVHLIHIAATEYSDADDDFSANDLLRPRHQLLEELQHLKQASAAPNRGFYGAGNTIQQSPEQDPSSTPDPLMDSLEDLMGLVAATCRLEPTLATKYWMAIDENGVPTNDMFADNSNPALKAALRFIPELQRRVVVSNEQRSMYVAFLNLLAALSPDVPCAEALFDFLKGSSGDISLTQLLTALEYYCEQLSSPPQENELMYPQQMNAKPKVVYEHIPPRDQVIVTCWLRVLRSVLRTEAICIQMLQPNGQFDSGFQTRNVGIDELLMVLAKADLTVELKAEIYLTLASLVKSDRMAAQIWARMEKYQLLHTFQPRGNPVAQGGLFGVTSGANPAGGQFGAPQLNPGPNNPNAQASAMGVRYDLENKETVLKQYPATFAFLDLLWRLLQYRLDSQATSTDSNTPPNQQQFTAGLVTAAGGADSRSPGSGLVDLQPYLDFVVHDVFLRHDQRGYQKHGEKWKISAACFRVIVLILDHYDVNVDFTQRAGEEPQNCAGFWLMTQLLHGGQLFKKVMDLLSSSGGAEGLEAAARGTTLSHPTAPSAMMHNGANHQMMLQNSPSDLKTRMLEFANWYLVAYDRANLDVEHVNRHTQAVVPQTSFGIFRTRKQPESTSTTDKNLVYGDRGRFAAWLLDAPSGQPLRVEFEKEQQRHGATGGNNNSQSSGNPPLSVPGCYPWDDGDAGGQWREFTVKLIMRLIDVIIRKEDGFVNAIRGSSTIVTDRLERIHRLLLSRQDKLLVCASLMRYPLSFELQLLSIRLFYRLSEMASKGAIVHAFGAARNGESLLMHAFNWCMSQTNLARVAGLADADLAFSKFEDFTSWSPSSGMALMPKLSMDSDGGSLVEENCLVEQFSAGKVQAATIELLLSSLRQPRPNLAQLVLGIRSVDDRAALGGVSDNINNALRVSANDQFGCFTTILNMLDNNLQCKDMSLEIVEQQYQLLYNLCESPVTGESVLVALRTQRQGFWTRHLQEFPYGDAGSLSEGNPASNLDAALSHHILAWILKGVALELRVAMNGSYASKNAVMDIISCLFSGRGAEQQQQRNGAFDGDDFAANSRMDQSRMKILEILDLISFGEAHIEADVPHDIKRVVYNFESVVQNGSPNDRQPQDDHVCLEAVEQYCGHVYHQFNIEKLYQTLQMVANSGGGGGSPSTAEPETSASASQKTGPKRASGASASSSTMVVASSDGAHKQALSARKQHHTAALEWALNWNLHQKLQGSKGHLVQAWQLITESSIFMCKDYLAAPGFAPRSGKDLYYVLVQALLQKLGQNPLAHRSLAEPISMVILDLVSLISAGKRAEEDGGDEFARGTANGGAKLFGASSSFTGSAQEDVSPTMMARATRDAIVSANGAFSAGYGGFSRSLATTPIFLKDGENAAGGLMNLSVEQHRALLANLLDVLHRKHSGHTTTGSKPSIRMRCSLYAAIVHLLLESRALYSVALRMLSPISRQDTPETTVPLCASEYAFLNATGGLSSTETSGGPSNPWHAVAQRFGAEGNKAPNTRGMSGGAIEPVLRELRNRALVTIEVLENDNRGITLLDMVSSDAQESSNSTVRTIALSTMSAIMPCDRTGKWLSMLRRKRSISYMVSSCAEYVAREDVVGCPFGMDMNLVSTYVHSKDTVYACMMSTLIQLAETKPGALAVGESGLLSLFTNQQKPNTILCEKRALSSSSYQQNTMVDDNSGNLPSLQELRHNTVLPLLRLILTILATLSSSSAGTKKRLITSNKEPVEHVKFYTQILEFLKSQRRLVTSVLGFPPTSLADLMEATLLVAILGRCAVHADLYVQVLGNLAVEFDSLVDANLRELCAPGREAAGATQVVKQIRQWDEVAPVSDEEVQRAKVTVASPPDLYFAHRVSNYGNSERQTTLFDLDKHSREMMLLRNLVYYMRVRGSQLSSLAVEVKENNPFGSTVAPKSDVLSLVQCIDVVSQALNNVVSASGLDIGAILGFDKAAVGAGVGFSAMSRSRASPRFDAAARSKMMGAPGGSPVRENKWFNSPIYLLHSVKQLLFVLENALFSLYVKLKRLSNTTAKTAAGSRQVGTILEGSQLLGSYYGKVRECSAVEAVEVKLKESYEQPFVHVVLRKMRDLYHQK